VVSVEDKARFLELLRVLGGDLGTDLAVVDGAEVLGGIIKQFTGLDLW